MPDQKLSQLQSATTPLAGTEQVYVVQGGNSRKTTVSAVAPGTNLTYTPASRTLVSSTGDDVVLPLATDSLDGLMSAAQRLLTQALIDAGVSVTGSVVSIPHMHGDLAGAVYIHVKNTSGGQLVKGTPVRVTGTVGDTTTLEVAAADATSQATMPAIGILDATLAQNGTGHAVVAGELTGLATASYVIGDPLYVAIGGGLTVTRPTTGLVQQVAIVGRVNASTGSVTVTIGSEMDPNWDTAYNERLRWDGGATGLNAATGRASLGLGSLATQSGTFSGTSSGTNTGDVTLAASVADVLNLSGQELQADDPGGDRLLFWDDSEGKLTHLQLGTNLSITGTTLNAASGGGGGGTKTFARLTARDNQPPAANFATLDTRNSVSVLEFDATTEESAVFVSVIPEGANLTSGLLVRIWWMGDTATSGNVQWAASFERSGTDLDADSFDTATEVTSAVNGTSGIETVAEITCTAIDSLAAGERFRLRIARKAADATNDTMTGDAQIIAVEVRGVA